MTEAIRLQLEAARATPKKPPAARSEPKLTNTPPAPVAPATPRQSGQYGHTYVQELGTRYIVVCPASPDPAYLAEWTALNERYGLRPAATTHFTASLQDAHAGKGKKS